MFFTVKLLIILLIPVIGIKAYPNRTGEYTANLIPCKEDWFLFGDKCYKAGGRNVGLTWEQASLYCEQEQGTLVTIDSQELQDFLEAFLLFDVKRNVWIGLNNLRSLFYRWADGSAVTFNKLNETAYIRMKIPKRGTGCVQLPIYTSQPGHWTLANCNRKDAYICQTNKSERRKNSDPRFCSEEEGGGWRHSKSCYHVITEPKTWEDAENACQAFDGHLVTILEDTTKYFLNYILSDVGDAFWIGIKLQETVHQKWTSGWRVNFQLLEAEDNDFAADRNCFARTGKTSFTRFPCSNMLPYICERTTEKPPIEDDWDCPSLSRDWRNVNGEYCYMLNIHRKPWFQANYECMRKGGSLVSIHSVDEAFVVYSMYTNYLAFLSMFIGLHRNFTNKQEFEWIDGSDLSYQNWGASEPDDATADCVTLFRMRWYDRSCDAENGFICSARKVRPKLPEEKEIIPSTELSTTTCICPTEHPTTLSTELVTDNCTSTTCPSPVQTEECKSGQSIYTLPPHINRIIKSAVEGYSCPMLSNITDAIESALKRYADLSINPEPGEEIIKDKNLPPVTEQPDNLEPTTEQLDNLQPSTVVPGNLSTVTELGNLQAVEPKIIPPPTNEIELNPNDLNWLEYYRKGYCRRQGEIYAMDSEGNELYGDDPDTKDTYVCEKIFVDGVEEFIQVPVKSNDGKSTYIKDENGRIKYPWNLTKNRPIFPREETYITVDGIKQYPLNEQGQPVYPKDSEGNDKPMWVTDRHVYLKDLNGTEIYPKKANGDQFYIRLLNREIYAKKDNGDGYYAKRADGDEFYPKKWKL